MTCRYRRQCAAIRRENGREKIKIYRPICEDTDKRWTLSNHLLHALAFCVTINPVTINEHQATPPTIYPLQPQDSNTSPMLIDRQRTRFSCNGEALNAAPRCPGVYRFYSEEDTLLYIGKSIDIGTRLNSHFADAREPGRQQRMMSAVHRIDCQLTAGEVGALLIENAAIKAETPLYNRRQRRSRKLWTQRLQEDVEGFLQVIPSDFCPAGERIESVFGLFRSRKHIDNSLRSLARDNGLCLRMLGAERGRGPCFGHQVGRCHGACAGKESADAHNSRLLQALDKQRIAAWPFAGPVLLQEERDKDSRYTGESSPLQPKRQFHLINHWSYLGTFERRDRARQAAKRDSDLIFDRDTYRIAVRSLRQDAGALLDGVSGGLIDNPFALNRQGAGAPSLAGDIKAEKSEKSENSEALSPA
ncbi:GIY-YIG nuclease family protein [Congregibacter litoralis]|uniref:Excinuclease cho n=1 Tax=Congregibacter litoralis KT71 TaxID=314285 RepID=A4AB96_9GAMM|nr:GIY-YIG nuclease family protein [Congregibacter litoralis]EAQ96650.1 GIY-YIG catalytic domain protein [Congregibacter litoralis KT71]